MQFGFIITFRKPFLDIALSMASVIGKYFPPKAAGERCPTATALL